MSPSGRSGYPARVEFSLLPICMILAYQTRNNLFACLLHPEESKVDVTATEKLLGETISAYLTYSVGYCILRFSLIFVRRARHFVAACLSDGVSKHIGHTFRNT